MGKEILMCGDIEIEQNEFHHKKDSISNTISFGEKKL